MGVSCCTNFPMWLFIENVQPDTWVFVEIRIKNTSMKAFPNQFSSTFFFSPWKKCFTCRCCRQQLSLVLTLVMPRVNLIIDKSPPERHFCRIKLRFWTTCVETTSMLVQGMRIPPRTRRWCGIEKLVFRFEGWDSDYLDEWLISIVSFVGVSRVQGDEDTDDGGNQREVFPNLACKISKLNLPGPERSPSMPG